MNTVTAERALPRTLIPLKDESLAGYLLRLSHRLEFTPLELGQVLGLAGGSWSAGLAGRLSLEIPEDRAAQFAERARLSAAEVEALTYRPDAGVYPAVDVTPYATVSIWTQRVVRFEPWLRNASTRYCPRCLVGDGSTIQARHGGAWSKYWRFAPVFACVEHGRLLDYLCPVCAQPALTRNPTYASQLIPLPAVAGLHPAACRAPTADRRKTCPGRFDEPAATAPTIADPAILQPLLNFQIRINALLATRDPQDTVTTSCGRPVTAAQYFADMQAASNMLATVALHPALADPALPPMPGLERFYAQLRAFAADPARRGLDPLLKDHTYGRFGSQTAIPLDSAACGCLLVLADGLLSAPDIYAAADQMEVLFGNVDLSRCLFNIGRWTRPDAPTSPGLKTAIGEARQSTVQVFSTPNAPTPRLGRRWRDLRLALTGGVSAVPGFGADRIPQRLPESWWARHFGHHGATTRHARRRLAVITLTVIAEDCSIPQAMRRLDLGGHGFSLEAVEAAAAMRKNEAARFAESMSAMIEDLNSQVALTDYDRRRHAMEHWRLDDATWEHLADGIRDRTLPQTTWNDEKRLLCAIYIWRQVTDGEHLRAPVLPRPFASATGRDAKRQYVRMTWREFSRVRPNSYLHELMARMDDYAHRLITHIDTETRSTQDGSPGINLSS